jgi:biopolymer transport protein ExbB
MRSARMFRRIALPALTAALLLDGAARAQESFDAAASSAQRDLESSLRELAALRERIAAEKIPMAKKVADLEADLARLRSEQESIGRTVDTRNLDFTTLQTEVKARQDEVAYLSNLIGEYVRNFETRIDISELQRYRDALERGRLAQENTALSRAESFGMQTDVVELSVDRLLDLVGGTTFSGDAVGPDGKVRAVTFGLIGPVTVYAAGDGSSAGTAEQRLGSLEPNMVPVAVPDLAASVSGLLAAGKGTLPFDPSLGNARKVEETKETLVEHISKGGPVMIPILLMAGAALVVALLKWIQLVRVRIPSTATIDSLLEAVRRGDRPAAARVAERVPGPVGEMIRAGVDKIGEPKDYIEEVMFERMLETRLELQGFLPFIALSASAAPLLGLLGTVTGMISTFKLITVFGSGDAKTLSSGISEALITTEFGLIVAIPSLLIYAYLSRKSRAVIDGMEKTAVALLNRLPSSSEVPEGKEVGAA